MKALNFLSLFRNIFQIAWPVLVSQLALTGYGVIDTAMAEVKRKKGLPAIDALRLESFTEGPCAQIMHIGPFSEEGPTIERVHAFIQARGHLSGKHHEIYLSDIRRADPAKWKTVIRQPMC